MPDPLRFLIGAVDERALVDPVASREPHENVGGCHGVGRHVVPADFQRYRWGQVKLSIHHEISSEPGCPCRTGKGLEFHPDRVSGRIRELLGFLDTGFVAIE